MEDEAKDQAIEDQVKQLQMSKASGDKDGKFDVDQISLSATMSTMMLGEKMGQNEEGLERSQDIMESNHESVGQKNDDTNIYHEDITREMLPVFPEGSGNDWNNRNDDYIVDSGYIDSHLKEDSISIDANTNIVTTTERNEAEIAFESNVDGSFVDNLQLDAIRMESRPSAVTSDPFESQEILRTAVDDMKQASPRTIANQRAASIRSRSNTEGLRRRRLIELENDENDVNEALGGSNEHRNPRIAVIPGNPPRRNQRDFITDAVNVLMIIVGTGIMYIFSKIVVQIL